jgi:hypothetical protein
MKRDENGTEIKCVKSTNKEHMEENYMNDKNRRDGL